MIELAKIRTDGGTQSRAAINEETVADYAEAMADPNTVFPAVVVYFDGRDYWLADGFHRVAAWGRIGRIEVPADVRQGGRRQAVLHSCAANAAHGLRRTNADKRRAVMTLLEDDEWSKWSDREIARRCRVHHTTVSKVRADVTGEIASEPRTYTTKHGTEAQMDTSRIGKPEAPAEDHAIAVDEPQAALPRTDEPQPEPDRSQTGAKPEPEGNPKLRAEYRRLTDEAREDEWVNLRLSDAEQKQRIAAQRSEIADLKVRIKELSEGDQGATISKLQKRAQAAAYARDEAATRAKRFEYRMKQAEKERDAALADLRGQEIAL
ncbi:hypothetical protein KU6B_47950 [Mameliella alba]|uniref:hypothetical protein n=1 Tax=Mameliella alba TaxID=561184 RepID=UPI0013E4DAFA|nr:hypothetical protein [Mameliella alba]BBU58530.1 hypothetical protein KU6B_47950 [Mameliella alba]